MDLLEIRKKAKERKAAEEAARTEAAAEAGGPSEAEGPKPEKAVPKRRRKPAAKPGPEPVQPSGPALEGPAEAAQDAGPPPGAPAPSAPAEPSMGGGAEGLLPAAPGEEVLSDEDMVEYLAFRLSNEEYAVKVEDVKEIIRLQKITDVPRAPGFVKGIISLRGIIIPVFDVKNRLGLEAAERTRSTRIIVVSDEGSPQGIIVDKVTGVVRLRADGIEPPPAVIGGVEAEYLDGVGRVGDRLLILFNTDKVLAI